MRFLKLALISFIVLFLVVTAIGLLFPSSVRVSRAININISPDSLQPYISNPANWKLWMQNAGGEAGIEILSSKKDGEGTVIKMGTGEIRITKSVIDTVETIWKNRSGKIQTSGFILVPDSLKKVTRLQWYFEQPLKWYPWERFGAMLNEKILGPSMDSGINLLKKIAEKQ